MWEPCVAKESLILITKGLETTYFHARFWHCGVSFRLRSFNLIPMLVGYLITFPNTSSPTCHRTSYWIPQFIWQSRQFSKPCVFGKDFPVWLHACFALLCFRYRKNCLNCDGQVKCIAQHRRKGASYCCVQQCEC